MQRKTLSSILIPGVSALVLGISVALLWVVVLRETSRKDLLLEYEAFRASSAVAEEYRRDRSFSPSDDNRILGFGFFRIDGTGIQIYGSAPESISIPSQFQSDRPPARSSRIQGSVESYVSAQGKSIVLIRYSGMQNPFRPMGMRQGMGRNRMGPSFSPPWQTNPWPVSPPSGTDAPAPSLIAGLSSPHFIWIEYGAGEYRAERIQSFVVAALVTLALLAFYLLFLRMSRRNEALAAQELQSRELVQLGEAARTLVHEIKNPLGIMRIQTARIRKGLGEDLKGQVAAATAVIDGEIRRLSDLADRIREFLKSSPARLEALDLMPFLQEFSARYANLESSGIEFSVEVPAIQSAFVEADREKLVIVLDNIVGNAIEAVQDMPEGEKKVFLRLFEKEKSWTIGVIDTGKGIPPEIQGRVFTPFFTTKEKGSGIGLSLARRFAESFGAVLELETQGSTKGAVFLLRLRPAAPQHGEDYVLQGVKH
ncbi:MAG: integral membrane sensor signal transduction histidine kinase [Spirochaetes bacterium]|nr:MAG: integral membrane sensor signal transduction histidine kinase [Spirochaetota bacterium]